MAGLITQLTDCLTDQIANYDALIALSEIKKDIIINNDAETLSKITSEENAIVGKLQKLEKTRMSVMREIGIVLDIKNENYTLTDLCASMEGQAEQDILRGLISDLREKLGTLRAINTQNKTLVENSLEYIDFSVNVMRSSADPEKKFYNTAGDEIVPGTGFFDARQ